MKLNKNSLPITIITISVLIGTLMISPISNSTAQDIPSSIIEVGDRFFYAMNQYSSSDDVDMFQFSERDNLTNLKEYTNDGSHSQQMSDGILELFFGRNVDPSPSLDTTFTMRIDLTNQPGSNVSGYNDNGNWDGYSNQFQWNNATPWYQDLSYQSQEYEGQESARSNQTYSFIPIEMEALDLDVPEDVLRDTPLDEVLNQGPSSTTVPLIARDTYGSTDNYTINGKDYTNMNLITAWSDYYGSFSGTYNETIDTNGKEIVFSGNYILEYGKYSEFTYDSATSLLVEVYQTEWSRYHIDGANSSFLLWDNNGVGGLNMSGLANEDKFWDLEQSMTLEKASSHYGNSRPLSSGENLLEEGNQLLFDMVANGESSQLIDIWYGDNRNYISSETSSQSTGDLLIDVYRHQNGSFEAFTAFNQHIIIQSHISENGKLNQGVWEWKNQTQPTFWYDEFSFEDFDTASNSSYEIEPFLESEMWIDYGEDQGGGLFGINFERNIPMLNSSSETIYENFIINSRDYFIEAELIAGNYEMSWSGNDLMCFGPCGGLEVPVDVDVHAFGRNEFVYDSWTGALLEVSDKIEYEIFVYGDIEVKDQAGNPILDPSGNPYHAGIDMTVYGYSDFEVTIATHPKLYQSVQTVFPTPPVTTTDPPVTTDPSTNTTTTTNTTSTSETSTKESGDTSETPDLPLPLPIMPFAIGLLVVSVIYTKRKR